MFVVKPAGHLEDKAPEISSEGTIPRFEMNPEASALNKLKRFEKSPTPKGSHV